MTSDWSKSSYSGARGDCAECRTDDDTAHLRDTQHRDQAHLTFPHHEWTALVAEAASL